MLRLPPNGPGEAIVSALKRAPDYGASKKDIGTIVRVMQWLALHNSATCSMIREIWSQKTQTSGGHFSKSMGDYHKRS